MKRIGFQFKVRQDHLAKYKEHHKHVWPEMLDALRETGDLERILRAQLEPFYSSPEVTALLD